MVGLEGARLVVHGDPHGAGLGDAALGKRASAGEKLCGPGSLASSGVGD